MIKQTKVIRPWTHETAYTMRCTKCGTDVSFMHDTKWEAVAEYKRRGHSKSTCKAMIQSKQVDPDEMDKKSVDLIDDWIRDYDESLIPTTTAFMSFE